MKIVIFGAAGQVGSEMVRKLQVSLQKLYDGAVEVVSFNRQDLNLMDLEALNDMILEIKPEWIVNAVAYTAVEAAEGNKIEAYRLNEMVPERLAYICHRESIALVHFSTDYVFSGRGVTPYTENDETAPLNTYGLSKFSGEEAIRENLNRHLNIRTSWVFGTVGNNFVKTMLSVAKKQKEVSVVADQFGAPTSTKSLVSLVAGMINTMHDVNPSDARWGTYHFSGLPFVTWAEFAEEIFKQALKKRIISNQVRVRPVASSEFMSRVKRPTNSRLDSSKVSETFGIKPDNWRKNLSEVLDRLHHGERA